MQCLDSSYFPQRVCVAAGQCGDLVVDPGELCDDPPPSDHCATSACVACRPRDVRPGWIDVTADVDGYVLSVNDFVGEIEPGCFRNAGGSAIDGMGVDIRSCDPAHDLSFLFRAPPMVGTFPLDGMTFGTSDLCVYQPNSGASDQDILRFCAFERGATADPAESGSVTVDEILCRGYGARGHVEGHLLYKDTILAAGAQRYVDPNHAGESVDISIDFNVVGRDTNF
jgi:hypothetical protein